MGRTGAKGTQSKMYIKTLETVSSDTREGGIQLHKEGGEVER